MYTCVLLSPIKLQPIKLTSVLTVGVDVCPRVACDADAMPTILTTPPTETRMRRAKNSDNIGLFIDSPSIVDPPRCIEEHQLLVSKHVIVRNDVIKLTRFIIVNPIIYVALK